jgi:hypothetical protein
MKRIMITIFPLTFSLACLFFLSFGTLTSCALTETRPKLEMSLAASAFLAAQEAKANSMAPGLFRKAEIYYIKAKSAYRRKYFAKAKQFAMLSQKFAEQAEFLAVKKATLEGSGSDDGPSNEEPAAPPPPNETAQNTNPEQAATPPAE